MVKLSATIWEARDVYLILLNDNGMIYHTQTGGELHDEEEAKGFLIPFPIYKNKEFCRALFALFQDFYCRRGDECRLNEDPQLCQKISTLLEEFNLADIIEIDINCLNQSYNQWIYVQVKKGFHDMLMIPQDQLPHAAILIWNFNEPFHERPDYHVYENILEKHKQSFEDK